MADEKQKKDNPQQQQSKGDSTQLNPFREVQPTENTKATPEEEADREQQLKEAMTERD